MMSKPEKDNIRRVAAMLAAKHAEIGQSIKFHTKVLEDLCDQEVKVEGMMETVGALLRADD